MTPRAVFTAEGVVRQRHQKGWVEERGSERKYWYGHWYSYSKDEQGRDVRKQTGEVLGFKSEMTKGAARDKLQKIIFERCGEQVKPSDAVTLEWFYTNRFEPLRRGNWSPATLHGNQGDMERYIKPALGKVPLREFDLFRCQTYLNKLADSNYSESLVARCRTMLWSIFDVAVELDYLRKNPMARVDVPKCKPTPKPIIAKEDIARLFGAVTDTRDRLILMLGVFAGPRSSEVFGIQWDCYKGDHIEIRNTAWCGKLYEWRVKRRDSFRRIKLGPQTQQLFEKWRAECSDAAPEALVFPGRGGRPLWVGSFLQKRIQPIAKSLGITVPVTFQVLRRSCTTRNQKHGTMKDVQAHMGHASIETTGDVYMMEIPESVARMVELDEMDVLGSVQ